MSFTYETTEKENEFLVTVVNGGTVLPRILFVTKNGASDLEGMVDRFLNPTIDP